MSARWEPKSSLGWACEIVAVEVEGDGVGRFGARLLGKRRGIEHEQEGSLLGGVEYDREQRAVIFGAGCRSGHEDRLAGIKSRHMPSRRRAGFGIDLDD